MLRPALAIVCLLLVQACSFALRWLALGLEGAAALTGSLGALIGLVILLDGQHRLGLGRSWLLAALPVSVSPWLGGYGWLALVFWAVVYGVDLRHRGLQPTTDEPSCPRCRAPGSVEVGPQEYFCPQCGHTFDEEL